MTRNDPQFAKVMGRVAAHIADHRNTPHFATGRLHVACSGGADSMFLLVVLRRLSRRFALELSVGHVDHGLRAESSAEGERVRELATALGLPFLGGRLRLMPGSGLSARARDARRTMLREQAQERGAEAIALAHSATDQAETQLLHITRGSGLLGVGGMRVWNQPFFRPLLGVTRDEIRSLAKWLKLPFVDDPTNRDERHPRVMVREQVLPRLRELNPQLERAFSELALHAQAAEDTLEIWANREAEARRLDSPYAFSFVDFDQLPEAIGLRVLRAFCQRAGVESSDLTFRVQQQIWKQLRFRAAVFAERLQRPAGGISPIEFHLRPQRVLTLQKEKIVISCRLSAT